MVALIMNYWKINYYSKSTWRLDIIIIKIQFSHQKCNPLTPLFAYPIINSWGKLVKVRFEKVKSCILNTAQDARAGWLQKLKCFCFACVE